MRQDKDTYQERPDTRQEPRETGQQEWPGGQKWFWEYLPQTIAIVVGVFGFCSLIISILSLAIDALNARLNSFEAAQVRAFDDFRAELRDDVKEVKGELKEVKTELGGKIDGNTKLLAGNSAKIDANAKLLAGNSAKIDANAKLLASNSAKIDANSKLLASNSAKIDLNSKLLEELRGVIPAGWGVEFSTGL